MVSFRILFLQFISPKTSLLNCAFKKTKQNKTNNSDNKRGLMYPLANFKLNLKKQCYIVSVDNHESQVSLLLGSNFLCNACTEAWEGDSIRV